MEGEGGRFRRRHLVPVPRVESLAELNAQLEAADRSDDARHIAGRLATVGQAAEAERATLRALPAEPFDPTVALRAKADRKARIAVRGSRYSVPLFRLSTVSDFVRLTVQRKCPLALVAAR